MFKGIETEEDTSGYHAAIKEINEALLPEGDAILRANPSTPIYKYGLSIAGTPRWAQASGWNHKCGDAPVQCRNLQPSNRK